MFHKLENVMYTLYGRWQDEKEYEDIADYGVTLRSYLPEGFELTKMHKKPFGFEFTLESNPGAVYFVKMTAKEYSWGRKP